MKKYLPLIIIFAVITPALLGYFYATYFSAIPEVLMPDLTGKTLEKAMIELDLLNLKGRHAGNVFDLKYSEGQVVSQRPEADRMVKAGRIVSLITSSGRQKVAVPNLLGRPADQAEAVLVAEGLLLGEATRDFVSELDSGIILTQNPLPEDEVEIGSKVDITVSSTQEIDQPFKREENNDDKKEKEGGFWPWQ
ncbi:hypothetical protein A3H09_00320 [Candidatus Falkowbacteria bacterium RIFCSPLOWO2_12_FULL_45_13]|uniref:PASTA domain-containing protein n=2 Tax=Bacteria TaxID=2 RepID=A0A1F4RAW8_UNCSA|nr:MAG: hypothetical protein A3J44_00880 [candidate division WOR-1 bacterium RIFCSPHIGHO2_02_FULL_45_12]OGC05314.1 MAG: hypothetical protein A3H38_02610 [candidate division WOR-1 bacterium RIFCSPLOWO2_02_FULL_46_20]OGF32125.1 MAG: hypothetical protein A3H09_00320 [Candidatus Falkowbacteria bacterium RIFCSPLOWO2_12_FULL_45_13]